MPDLKIARSNGYLNILENKYTYFKVSDEDFAKSKLASNFDISQEHKYELRCASGIISYWLDGEKVGDLALSEQSLNNLPPRIRMATLYAVSQSCNGRVANTCNLSEDWVGYSTRYGDAAGDFSPLSKLTVTEVKQIGHLLGHAELEQIRVGAHKCFFKVSCQNLGCDLFDRALAVVAGFVEYKSCHFIFSNL